MWRVSFFGHSPIESATVCVLLATAAVDLYARSERGDHHSFWIRGALILGAVLASFGCFLGGSRGPAIALCSGLAIQYLMFGPVKGRRMPLFLLLLACAILLHAFLWRPVILDGSVDGSVANRGSIFLATFKMMFLAPFRGLGEGEGGYIYSQWYQPDHLSYSYRSLYNEWLQLGVEHGIPAFIAGLFITLLAIGGPFCELLRSNLRSRIIRSRLGESLGVKPYLYGYAGTVVFAVVGTSSIITNSPLVCTLGCLNMSLLVFSLLSSHSWIDAVDWRRYVSYSLLLTSLIVATLAVGAIRHTGPRIELLENKIVKISGASSKAAPIMIFVDPVLMIGNYGQVIREWQRLTGNLIDVLVCDPRHPVPNEVQNFTGEIWILGGATEELGEVQLFQSSRIVLINPSAIPPRKFFGASPAVLVLTADRDHMERTKQSGLSEKFKILTLQSSSGLFCGAALSGVTKLISSSNAQ